MVACWLRHLLSTALLCRLVLKPERSRLLSGECGNKVTIGMQWATRQGDQTFPVALLWNHPITDVTFSHQPHFIRHPARHKLRHIGFECIRIISAINYRTAQKLLPGCCCLFSVERIWPHEIERFDRKFCAGLVAPLSVQLWPLQQYPVYRPLQLRIIRPLYGPDNALSSVTVLCRYPAPAMAA